jgi:branched-subunit amino acid aminotransferase/4-amino-4-deoxychorismate lyase
LFEWSYEKAGLEFAKNGPFEVVEEAISPLIYKKADELFITNVIKGIQPITKYRKKEFDVVLAKVIGKIERSSATNLNRGFQVHLTKSCSHHLVLRFVLSRTEQRIYL